MTDIETRLQDLDRMMSYDVVKNERLVTEIGCRATQIETVKTDWMKMMTNQAGALLKQVTMMIDSARTLVTKDNVQRAGKITADCHLSIYKVEERLTGLETHFRAIQGGLGPMAQEVLELRKRVHDVATRESGQDPSPKKQCPAAGAAQGELTPPSGTGASALGMTPLPIPSNSILVAGKTETTLLPPVAAPPARMAQQQQQQQQQQPLTPVVGLTAAAATAAAAAPLVSATETLTTQTTSPPRATPCESQSR